MNPFTFIFDQPAGFSDRDFEVLANGLDQASVGGIGSGEVTVETDAATIAVTFDGIDVAAAVAILENVRDRVGPPIAVEEEDPELVGTEEIARRLDRSRQSIDQLVRGERGPGTFPRPIATASRAKVFSWPEVAAWAHDNFDASPPLPLESLLISALNARLRAFQAERRLTPADRSVVVELERVLQVS